MCVHMEILWHPLYNYHILIKCLKNKKSTNKVVQPYNQIILKTKVINTQNSLIPTGYYIVLYLCPRNNLHLIYLHNGNSAAIHGVLSLWSRMSHWQLETCHSGRICTTAIGEHYLSWLFFPWRASFEFTALLVISHVTSVRYLTSQSPNFLLCKMLIITVSP
jgi:hypothetical protein